jgi:hypothetical protein
MRLFESDSLILTVAAAKKNARAGGALRAARGSGRRGDAAGSAGAR